MRSVLSLPARRRRPDSPQFQSGRGIGSFTATSVATRTPHDPHHHRLPRRDLRGAGRAAGVRGRVGMGYAMTRRKLSQIIAALDGYVGAAEVASLACGQVTITVADLRELAAAKLREIEAKR